MLLLHLEFQTLVFQLFLVSEYNSNIKSRFDTPKYLTPHQTAMPGVNTDKRSMEHWCSTIGSISTKPTKGMFLKHSGKNKPILNWAQIQCLFSQTTPKVGAGNNS